LLNVASALIVAGLGAAGLWDLRITPWPASHVKQAESGCGGERVYSTKDPGVHSPRRRRGAPPKYPDMTGHTFVGTPAIFEVVVNSKGVVCEIRTVRAPRINPPLPAFGAALRRSITESEFRPGTKDRRPVAVRMTVTITIDVH